MIMTIFNSNAVDSEFNGVTIHPGEVLVVNDEHIEAFSFNGATQILQSVTVSSTALNPFGNSNNFEPPAFDVNSSNIYERLHVAVSDDITALRNNASSVYGNSQV